jgi:hypothetical protein
MKELGGGGGGGLGGFLAKNKKNTLAAQVGVSTRAWFGACKVTHTQEEVKFEKVDVMCGKNLVKIVTKG